MLSFVSLAVLSLAVRGSYLLDVGGGDGDTVSLDWHDCPFGTEVVALVGFEPTTVELEVPCSIQAELQRHIKVNGRTDRNRTCNRGRMRSLL